MAQGWPSMHRWIDGGWCEGKAVKGSESTSKCSRSSPELLSANLQLEDLLDLRSATHHHDRQLATSSSRPGAAPFTCASSA